MAILRVGSDFDKRMALISYDNAIEVSVTTFLQLHPSQRGGKIYERKKTDEWLSNYHKKLEFFELFAKEKGALLPVSIDEIIYYHNLRNELYHSGNGLVPESNHLNEARNAALSVFTCLFDVNAESLLLADWLKVRSEAHPAMSAQSAFLEAFIELEKTLKTTLHGMGIDNNFFKIPMKPAWRLFVKTVGKLPKEYSAVVYEAIGVRNAVVHGQPTGLGKKEFTRLRIALEKVTEFVSKYATSVDILPELRKRYPNWVRSDLTAVRIVQKSGRAFLETTVGKTIGPVRDEQLERMDLGFISEEPYSDKNMFSPERTAAENADKLLEEFDPYSLAEVTNIFRKDAYKHILAEFGPTKKVD